MHTSNHILIIKQKSEEPSAAITHPLRRCLTLRDKSESEEANDILSDIMTYDHIKPAKRSRTKWIVAAVSIVILINLNLSFSLLLLLLERRQTRKCGDDQEFVAKRKVGLV